MTPYSTHKTSWHGHQLALLARGCQPNPIHVQMIPSDWCNHDCSFCAYRMSGYTSNELFQIDEGQSRRARNPKRFMPKEKACEILEDCSDMGVKAVQFTGGGEPTMHPEFKAIATHANYLGLETALVTNGSMLLDDELLGVLEGMAWVRVSVDAGKASTYCAARSVGEGMWSRVLAGIGTAAKHLLVARSRTVLGAGFVVTPQNWREMPLAVGILRDLGVHNVRLGLMFNPEGSKPYAEHRREIEDLASRVQHDHDGRGFTVINRVSEKLGELDTGRPPFGFCSYQHFTTYIGADLNVYRCCVYAYNSRGVVGSLEDQRFVSLWRSAAKQQDYQAFDARGCARCQFTEIIQHTNAAILDCAQDRWRKPAEQPVHANFA